MPSTYFHRQRSPLYLLFFLVGTALIVAGFWFRNAEALPYVLPLAGVLLLAAAACFRYLTVADEGERLVICFGPLPLFRRHVRYDNVRSVEVGRTLLLDGWGIHFSLCGGWVWNIWGRDCVIVRLPRGLLMIGTDDPENLAEFLRQRAPIPAH